MQTRSSLGRLRAAQRGPFFFVKILPLCEVVVRHYNVYNNGFAIDSMNYCN
jgi:hypothetical protein